ncbi:hypothetical protein [Providencia sp. PROV196]|uniref:hypothetical protein n=1 Tax=Providencia sp. PROV196 TaxID=2949897 RepID=UPI00234B2D04|nr:hypothetical protein [Providencia sp. PROV196]
MKLQYLSSPMQSLDQAQETNFFALSPDVVRGIISDLQKHLETLENSEIQSPQGKKH